MDWTSSDGAAVGGSRAILHDEDDPVTSSSSGHRLGGGSAGASRLLHTATIVPQQPVTTTKPEISPVEQTQLITNKQPAAAGTEDVEMEVADSTTAEAVPLQQVQKTPMVTNCDDQQTGVHKNTIGEEVATLAMSTLKASRVFVCLPANICVATL